MGACWLLNPEVVSSNPAIDFLFFCVCFFSKGPSINDVRILGGGGGSRNSDIFGQGGEGGSRKFGRPN